MNASVILGRIEDVFTGRILLPAARVLHTHCTAISGRDSTPIQLGVINARCICFRHVLVDNVQHDTRERGILMSPFRTLDVYFSEVGIVDSPDALEGALGSFSSTWNFVNRFMAQTTTAKLSTWEMVHI